MSKTKGEGRTPSEKSQKILTPYEVRKRELAKRQQEEKEWASRSGPVIIRKKAE